MRFRPLGFRPLRRRPLRLSLALIGLPLLLWLPACGGGGGGGGPDSLLPSPDLTLDGLTADSPPTDDRSPGDTTGGGDAGGGDRGGGDGGGGDGVIDCVPAPGIAEPVFADRVISDLIGTADGSLYFTDDDRIYRLQPGATTPELVVDQPSSDPMPVGSMLYYNCQGSLCAASLTSLPVTSNAGIADGVSPGFWSFDDEATYTVNTDTSQLVRYPFDGSDRQVLRELAYAPISSRWGTVAGGHAYFLDGQGRDLRRLPTSGGPEEVLVSTPLQRLASVAVRGDLVAYINDSLLYLVTVGSGEEPRAVQFTGFSGTTVGLVAFEATSGDLYVQSNLGGYARISPDLATCTVLGTDSGADFAVVDGYLYYSTGTVLMRIPL